MEKYINKKKNIKIIAKKLNIGKKVTFGNNISISLKGEFRIGDYSHLGDNAHIRGNNAIFGKHLFNSSGLRIGGGGRQHPNANFSIGDRCTIHNNFINIYEPVDIGNDVGLSPDVAILTHGYWQSVLEGYPTSFKGVYIGDGVIVGYRSLIMMGVKINSDIVVGANSVVTKDLIEKAIYAGNPARKISNIIPFSANSRVIIIEQMIKDYKKIAGYHNIQATIKLDYPFICIEKLRINVETFEYDGTEGVVTDDFRDYIRKFGIRIYTDRPFKSNFSFE